VAVTNHGALGSDQIRERPNRDGIGQHAVKNLVKFRRVQFASGQTDKQRDIQTY